MRDEIIFLVTTTKEEGKFKYASQINSHAAHVRHSGSLYRGRSRQSQFESPARGQDGTNRRGRRIHVAGTQRPWLLGNPRNTRSRPNSPLCSELVPPIRWPVEFATYEKNCIHFCLNISPQCSLSEGSRPHYSLIWDWARRLLESTQMFSICHVVISEQYMHNLYRRQPTKVFYARQAHAYRLMNDLLNSNDQSITCHERLLAFSQVIVMDLILRKRETIRHHARAVDEYIELCGGLRNVLAIPRNSRSAFDPWRFILYFSCVETPFHTCSRTQAHINRFLYYLRRVREWAAKSNANDDIRHVLSPDDHRSVATVYDYVLWSFQYCWKGPGKQYSANGATNGLILNMCLAQAEYNYSPKETLRLFRNLAPQVAHWNSKDSIAVFPRLHPASAISSLAYIRDDIRSEKGKEITLCEACLDSGRIIPLVSVSTMTRLIQTWIDCAFHPIGLFPPQSDTGLEPLSEVSLRELEGEIWSAWYTAGYDSVN